MGGKSFAILGLAVGCGLVAMYGVSQLVGGKEKPVEMRDVLVAAKNLRSEDYLKPDCFKLVKLAAPNVPQGAFTNPKDLDGRWVEIPLLAEEPIIEGKLAAKDAVPGLSGRIPVGMRAFSIEVSEESGVSGFVLPDHHVDILQELSDSRSAKQRQPSRTVLQNVLVLAAGQVITRGEDKSMKVRTVTLAVMPKQAEALVAARSQGPLSLALRGSDDAEIIPEPEPIAEEPPLIAVAPPVVVPLPEPAPRVRLRPQRRTLIIHGLQPAHVVNHRIESEIGVVAVEPASTPTYTSATGPGLVHVGVTNSEAVARP